MYLSPDLRSAVVRKEIFSFPEVDASADHVGGRHRRTDDVVGTAGAFGHVVPQPSAADRRQCPSAQYPDDPGRFGVYGSFVDVGGQGHQQRHLGHGYGSFVRKQLAVLQPRNDLSPLAHVQYGRSVEHTSELQSLMRISYAVFCLTNTKY